MPTAAPDLIGLAVQTLGTLLFFVLFLLVWRQSGIISLGSWTLAWLLEALALVFVWFYFSSGQVAWLAPYSFLEYSYALALAAAARMENLGTSKNWNKGLRALAGYPVFLAIVYALGLHHRFETFHALHSLVLAGLYLYGASRLHGGIGSGARWFRYALTALSAASLWHAAIFYSVYRQDGALIWPAYLRYYNLYDLALQTMLAFSAMAMWIENQRYRILSLDAELDRVRSETQKGLDQDRLTGLRNQAALEKSLESGEGFSGVVAVCDMDNFKSINDRFGHLVGDEILRNVGHLLRASIRQEDEAFRWGGDEFVILFHNQNRAVATSRMRALRDRLGGFQVRGYGMMPISFSWGTAELQGGSLRKALDDADRQMYANKRQQAQPEPQPPA
ncbi:MAG: GGDEF domain-containing protein [Candidatus Solibacter usitatus]|nr:GGDEF domain-containing protein [Candidatus Solibacter usitatus]